MPANPSPPSRRTILSSVAVAGLTSLAGCVGTLEDVRDVVVDDTPPPAEGYEVETVGEGFVHPWGVAFVPDGSQLFVTEREGTLKLLDREGGDTQVVEGTPEVHVAGQGGLLDVELHPEYPDESWVYLTYSVANDDGESTTALGRGQFDPDADEPRLEDFAEVHAADPYIATGDEYADGHFGSRVVFDEDGHVHYTTGDRQSKAFDEDHISQDTTNEHGATLRLEPDGSIPEDNPFVDDDDVTDAIYTYGHRNVQGMTVHPETGALWQSEHGEEDGDELNVLEAGGNYGWPVTHTGCEYNTDEPVGEDPFERDDVVDPVYYWECNSGGFPPAGMTFYDGEAFPEWQGDLFVGNLAGQYLGRFTVDGTEVEETESVLADRGWRIRDVAVAPDSGHLYVAVDDDDAPIVRLVPGEP